MHVYFIILLFLTSPIISFAEGKDKLPPMPDPIKNSTLLGVDSDKDGIRDDVQIWIEKNYPANLPLKSSLKQYAKAKQELLGSVNDKKRSNQAMINVFKATSCKFDIQTEQNTSIGTITDLTERLDAMFENTKERIDALKKQIPTFMVKAQLYLKNQNPVISED